MAKVHDLLCIILFASVSVCSSIQPIKAEVITLTADTFNDKVTYTILHLPSWRQIGNTKLYLRSELIFTAEEIKPDQLVNEKDTAWFVKFCVPSCKHCKNLGTLWEDLGKVMEGEDEIEIGEVDCGTNKAVCTKVDIHSYPTFKLFYNGEEAAKYQGPRDVESLRTFALEEAEKAATKAQHDSDKEL